MTRASRLYVPGQVWHITHRCHDKAFLFRFRRDRRRYRRWLFEARKRFGLCVLNYVVTSNHIHLLVKDTGEDVLAQSLQLAAGCTARQYNQRKHRLGAFWEDRYHATAIEAGEHLLRCVVYIDLNMVRAGVVRHPLDWRDGGYGEIQSPLPRYQLIDIEQLSALCGLATVANFQAAHRAWVAHALATNALRREGCWSEAVAVGSRAYTERMKSELGSAAQQRAIEDNELGCVLREPVIAYRADCEGQNGHSRPENARFLR